MKIIVCVKQVPDSAAAVTVHDGIVSWGDAPLVLNTWDEYAVEAALQLSERSNGEVSALSIAREDEKDALKTAIAMGCKDAVRITDPALDTLASARILATAIHKFGEVDLVCMGMQSIDTNYGVTAAQTGRFLGWQCITLVSKIIALDLTNKSIQIERVNDEGKQTLEVKLPLIMSFVKEIAEPRYPSFMGIRKAAKAQIVQWTLKDLGITLPDISVRTIEIFAPPVKQEKVEIISAETPRAAAEQLVDKLIAEKVLG